MMMMMRQWGERGVRGGGGERSAVGRLSGSASGLDKYSQWNTGGTAGLAVWTLSVG